MHLHSTSTLWRKKVLFVINKIHVCLTDNRTCCPCCIFLNQMCVNKNKKVCTNIHIKEEKVLFVLNMIRVCPTDNRACIPCYFSSNWCVPHTFTLFPLYILNHLARLENQIQNILIYENFLCNELLQRFIS